MSPDQNNLSTLVEALSSKTERSESVQAIVEHHSDSLRLVFGALDDADASAEDAIYDIFSQLPEKASIMLAEVIRNDDDRSRQIAIKALSHLGEASVPSALLLLEDDDPTISSMGGQVLRSIGPEAAAHIKSNLSTKDPSKRALALMIELDPECLSFFETAMEDAFGSSDQFIARFAIDAMATVGDAAIPFLIRLTGSANQFKQQNATAALVALGEIAVADLVDELDNPNALIQQNCSAALRGIGSPAIAPLNDAMDSDSALMQQNARAVLSTIIKPKRGLFRKR